MNYYQTQSICVKAESGLKLQILVNAQGGYLYMKVDSILVKKITSLW